MAQGREPRYKCNHTIEPGTRSARIGGNYTGKIAQSAEAWLTEAHKLCTKLGIERPDYGVHANSEENSVTLSFRKAGDYHKFVDESGILLTFEEISAMYADARKAVTPTPS